MATRVSSAAVYLTLATLLMLYVARTSDAQTTPSVPAGVTPSPEQMQMAFMLHSLMKNDPTLKTKMEYLIQLADKLPDNPPSSGVPSNPLMGMILNAISGMTKPGTPHTNVNSSGGSTGGGSQAPGGSNVLSLLMNNPLLADIGEIVMKQIMEGQSHTNATDMTSLLSLVNPWRVAQQLLLRRPARRVLPNFPPGHVSDVCYDNMMDTFDAVPAMKRWALDMIDAMGKPTPGLERGSFYFVGSYDECYMIKPEIDAGDVIGNVTVEIPRAFGTHFCRADVPIPQNLIDSLHVDTHGVRLKLTWGMCVPASCSSADMEGLFKLEALKSLPVDVESVYCYDDVKLEEDTSAITAITILSFFALLVTAGTLYDVYKSFTNEISKSQSDVNITKYGTLPDPSNTNKDVESQDSVVKTLSNGKTEEVPAGYMQHREDYVPASSPPNGDVSKTSQNNGDITKFQNTQKPQEGRDSFIGRFVQCFSVKTNAPKLLHGKAGKGAVHCVHGIRFFSLTWVVLGHTYNYGIISQDETFTAGNLLDFVPVMQRFTYQAVIGGGFAVDTFFVLSAFLLTWLQLKATKKQGRVTGADGFMYYFHRFWRLTPVYMLVLMTFGCLYRYMGSGPFWPSTIWAGEHCKTNWWTNLLYVNNLVGTEAQCMGWTWYLANDMQFYVISPIFLALMYWNSAAGVISTMCLLATGISITFWKEYNVNGNFLTMKSDGGDYWREVYTVPWCRVSCWAIGMLLGLLFYKRGEKPLRSRFLVACGWMLATGAALAIIYSPYSENKDGGTQWTNVQRAFYEALGRPVWGLCIAWVIFACHTGAGGVVNSIMSWPGFIPLSRLTYAAYLVHPICMMVYVFSRRTLLHVNDYNVVYLFLGHFCITYMVAFVVSLAFEAPAMALEKLLFHRGRRN